MENIDHDHWHTENERHAVWLWGDLFTLVWKQNTPVIPLHTFYNMCMLCIVTSQTRLYILLGYGSHSFQGMGGKKTITLDPAVAHVEQWDYKYIVQYIPKVLCIDNNNDNTETKHTWAFKIHVSQILRSAAAYSVLLTVLSELNWELKVLLKVLLWAKQ